jgi:uncharacterized protein (DUF849 family)
MTGRSQAVIIEAAVSGATTRERQRHAPRSLEEVSTEMEAAFQARASIVHNHPRDGGPSPDGLDFYAGAWRPVLANRPDALIHPSLGLAASFEERWGHVVALANAGRLRSVSWWP